MLCMNIYWCSQRINLHISFGSFFQCIQPFWEIYFYRNLGKSFYVGFLRRAFKLIESVWFKSSRQKNSMMANLIDWLIKSLEGKIISIFRIALILMFFSKSHLHKKANRQKKIFNWMWHLILKLSVLLKCKRND